MSLRRIAPLLAVFVFVGVLFIGVATYLANSRATFLHSAKLLPAEIMRVEDPGGGLVATVVFYDPAGQLRTTRTTVTSSYFPYRAGNAISVWYLNDQHKGSISTVIDDYTELWGLATFLVIFGLFFIAIAGLMAYFARSRK